MRLIGFSISCVIRDALCLIDLSIQPRSLTIWTFPLYPSNHVCFHIRQQYIKIPICFDKRIFIFFLLNITSELISEVNFHLIYIRKFDFIQVLIEKVHFGCDLRLVGLVHVSLGDDEENVKYCEQEENECFSDPDPNPPAPFLVIFDFLRIFFIFLPLSDFLSFLSPSLSLLVSLFLGLGLLL